MRWIILLVATALSLLVAEGALRAFPGLGSLPYQEPPIYEAHPDRGWRLQSNLDLRWPDPRFEEGGFRITTDSRGNRVAPGSEPDTAAAKVLLIGDSFAFGWGVEASQAIAGQLERALEVQLGGPVRIINAGVPNYGPLNEVATASELVPDLAPDVIVVLFFFNDVSDVRRGPDWVELRDGHLVTPAQGATWTSARSRVTRAVMMRSILSRVARKAWRNARRARETGGSERLARLGDDLELLLPNPSREAVSALRATSMALAQLRDVATRGSADLIVVTAPPSYHVFPELLSTSSLVPGVTSVDGVYDRLDAECRAEALNCAHLLPDFVLLRTAGATVEDLFIPGDGHWTAAAHELAAEAIAPLVLEMLRTKADR